MWNETTKLSLESTNFNIINNILYFFIILYIILIIFNYEHLKIELNGKLAFSFTILSTVFLLNHFLLPGYNFSSYLLPISLLLILTSIYLVTATYNRNEIRSNFILDPVEIGILVLFIFSVLNVFKPS